ncbi:MAG: FG-GAP repeat protein [Bacteroidetes bacterium]|nr:FG-GAP repeat protein [Bacteroidota bacterium]
MAKLYSALLISFTDLLSKNLNKSFLLLAGSLFLFSNLIVAQPGTVSSYQKISDLQGNFTGTLNDFDYFGNAVASLGDLDGDGITDIAVGADADDDGGTDRGAVWILFLNSSGQVKSHQKISDTQGGFTGILSDNDGFGTEVDAIGDLNGDGIMDLGVGASGDDDGGTNRGAVWILFMNTNGTVKYHQKISDTQGGFSGILSDGDYFSRVCGIGDYDGDNVEDILVGATNDIDGGSDRGAVWILYLYPNGTVKSFKKVSATQGNFNGVLDADDKFGNSVTSLGDFDGDGVMDFVVGAIRDDDKNGGGSPLQDRGAAWILLMNSNGSVKSYQKISDTQGNFSGGLLKNDLFGQDIAAIGDLNGDGVDDIVVGADGDDDGGSQRGAYWTLFLNSNGTVNSYQKVSQTQGGFTGTLTDNDYFGTSIAPLGDINGDGIMDLAIGAEGDDDGGSFRGAVWILFLNASPLPIELLSFDASALINTVSLNWSTASELNNDYFTIERSTDGNDFQILGTVKGSGNSLIKKDYNFIDQSPLNGIAYYRLKQTDFNGRFEYFDVVAVNTGSSTDITLRIYPNPAKLTDDIYLDLSGIRATQANIILLDNLGNEVYKDVLYSEDGEFSCVIHPMHNMAAGIYFVLGSTETSCFKKKMIIQ